MRRFYYRSVLSIICAALLLAVSVLGCSRSPVERDVLYQVSTINALLEGVYDGDLTFDELERHGDFGIGTFNDLDGEMIGLSGEFYQIKVDGKAYPAAGSMKTPFAVVTFFDADKTIKLIPGSDFEQLKMTIDESMPTENIFYAVKVEGTFQYMKVRSVPKQERPYPKLVEVVKDQAIYEYSDIEGTIVGFWCPEYAKGVNVSGYHFHFISKDKTVGGHILDCVLDKTTAEIDYTDKFTMVLPSTDDFYRYNLGEEKEVELERVEK